jgi:hypothetical protein
MTLQWKKVAQRRFKKFLLLRLLPLLLRLPLLRRHLLLLRQPLLRLRLLQLPLRRPPAKAKPRLKALPKPSN